MPSESPTPSSETDQAFSLSLTIYSQVKKGTTCKTREEKTTKTKELVFGVNELTENYFSFLRNVLLKHGLRDSNISERNNYSFKYLFLKYVLISFICKKVQVYIGLCCVCNTSCTH
jgi:hypothetical protein